MKKVLIEMTVNEEIKIRFELYPEVAPETVENFVKLTNEGFYNGVIFHRVIKDFMIQTGGYILDGMNIDTAKEVPSIVGEFSENGFENNLKHELGVVSMARTNDPNSASGQFFICAADCPWLDGKYAAFGKCIDEESIKNVLGIAEVETCAPHPAFQDFPTDIIMVTDMKVLGEE